MPPGAEKSIIKFPKQSRIYEPELQERGVPRIAFRFRKLDLSGLFQEILYENEKGKLYKVTPSQQFRDFFNLNQKLFKPRFVMIGTNPGGVGYAEASQMLLWLILQAFQRKTEVGQRLPRWFPIYHNFENPLLQEFRDEFEQSISGFEPPSFLVLDNLYDNSSNLAINKAQDLIYRYRYEIPVFVLVSGANVLEFSRKILHIQANYYFQVGPRNRVVVL